MSQDYASRNEGLTHAERHLGRLCNKSFLRLWSYSGVSRDQTNGQGSTQGKEICDLLVVFGNHLLIFSDKDCTFQSEKPVQIAWPRWLKHAILESAQQIYGAERWIKNYPDRLFVDLACKSKLPLPIPNPADARFHRIIVAHGCVKDCKRFFQGGSGSLMIDNRIQGEAQHREKPFQLGQPYPEKGFLHVFDDVTLDIVLKTLDTIKDFTDYLDRREAFLSGRLSISAVGEEELLANYLRELNSKGQHDFVVPAGFTSVSYDEGHWSHFINHAQRKLQLEANRQSYAWDDLIEVFTTHTLNGTHHSTTQHTIADQESLYKWLAREPRTRRRMLSNALLGLVAKTPKGMRAMRIVEPSYDGDPYFIFVVVPQTLNISEEDYRTFREGLLRLYCAALKVHDPRVLDVVGIATENGLSVENRSEDLVYVDMRDWTPEMAEETRTAREKLGLFTHPARYAGTEQEYPSVSRPSRGLRGPITISRNKKCPCGSGRRYSKCHGKKFFDRKRNNTPN